MLRFITDFVIFFATMALATVPVTKVARAVRRRHNRRKWLMWAGIVAFVVAGLGWSSRDLVTACKSERNEGCIDIGGAGSQFLFVATFVMFALGSAYMMWND